MTRRGKTAVAVWIAGSLLATHGLAYRIGVLAGRESCSPEPTDDQGWAKAKDKPTVSDAPRGSTPILHVSGSVAPKRKPRPAQEEGPRPSFIPHEERNLPPMPPSGDTEGSTPFVAGSIPQAAAVCVSEGWPTEADLGCSADADLVKVGEDVLARLRCSAEIVDPYNKRLAVLPLQPAGEIVANANTGIIAPKWRLDLLAGITTENTAEVGAAWTGRGRIGAYALAERNISNSEANPTWRAHIGIRWRIR